MLSSRSHETDLCVVLEFNDRSGMTSGSCKVVRLLLLQIILIPILYFAQDAVPVLVPCRSSCHHVTSCDIS